MHFRGCQDQQVTEKILCRLVALNNGIGLLLQTNLLALAEQVRQEQALHDIGGDEATLRTVPGSIEVLIQTLHLNLGPNTHYLAMYQSLKPTLKEW